MLNHYETVFIATPVLSENQMKEVVQNSRRSSPKMKVRSFMKRTGA